MQQLALPLSDIKSEIKLNNVDHALALIDNESIIKIARLSFEAMHCHNNAAQFCKFLHGSRPLDTYLLKPF